MSKVLEFKKNTPVDRLIDAMIENRDDIEQIVVSYKSKSTGAVQSAWCEMKKSDLAYHTMTLKIDVETELLT